MRESLPPLKRSAWRRGKGLLALGLAALTLAGCDGPTVPADEGPEAAPAIRITTVEANQGVGVRILEEGVPVPAAYRNAPLVERRPTLIRALWETDPGWRARSVSAELRVDLPGGGAQTFEQQRYVGAVASTFEEPGRGFAWEIPAELAVAGISYRISLSWPGWDAGTGEGAEPPSFPETPAPIGIEESRQLIRVTVVPVRHDFEGSCSEVPPMTQNDIETMGELLHRRNPTERVVMTLREPFDWDESLATYSGLLARLSQLRFEDGADPAEYYAGLVHHCVRVGGQAITIPEFPTRDNAWTRTVVSAWRGNAPLSSTTFVHEIGHAQGRRHVRCTGSEGGVDPNYPYAAGNIGVWGYSIVIPEARMPWLSGNLYHPVNANDYMGYCTGSQHVSDYGWRRVHPFIREISRWEAEGGDAGAPSSGRLLVGLLDPDGRESWFEVPGTAGDRIPEAGTHLRLADSGGRVVEVPAWAGERPGGGGTTVVAELPMPLAGVREVTFVRGGTALSVAPRAIRSFGGPEG